MSFLYNFSKKGFSRNRILILLFLLITISIESGAKIKSPSHKIIVPPVNTELDTIVADTIKIITIDSIGTPAFKATPVNKTFAPRVFSGYRNLKHGKHIFRPSDYIKYYEPQIYLQEDSILTINKITGDTLLIVEAIQPEIDTLIVEAPAQNEITDLKFTDPDYLPLWLSQALNSYRIQEDFIYRYMIENPSYIEYAYWDLPEPPILLPDDVSFKSYIRKLKLPEVDINKAVIPETELKQIHWLHTFSTLLQFSQAYVSPNWYQGGNNYLALLFNIGWGVNLNQAFHPNILFQSNFSYKLALSSNPKGQLHRYTISEDLLQYNLNAGLKAWKRWFYSFNLVFKTQLLNNYEENSEVRKASFLSPGDLNLGIGMSYNYANKYKTFQFTATISPLSYNLKTCISNKVDHQQFNIEPYRKTKSEIGSNAEINMQWNITSNISYKTRMFLFSDYKYFLTDWENTFSFSINKFLSTQLYIHLRYDSSAEKYSNWKNLMMREILSFGLQYTFSTKP